MTFSSKFTLETDFDQFQRLKESLPPNQIVLEKKDAGYFEGAVNDLGGLLSCSTLLKMHRYFFQNVSKKNHKQI